MAAPGFPARVAIVGAGWAGLAAAVHATQAGHAVTLFEAARQVGGRARRVERTTVPGASLTLDNGQHILIGAYTETLALMRTVGVSPEAVLLRRPLALRDANGEGVALPDLPAPWNALMGIARARGWSLRERGSLLTRAARWRLAAFRCAPNATVADLARGLPPPVQERFIEPLCVSALNTAAHEASGAVFLRVLQDALFATAPAPGMRASDLLLPRVDLGRLFPDAAVDWLRARAQTLRLGARVQTLAPEGHGAAPTQPRWQLDGAVFDQVILACPSIEAARLVHTAAAHSPSATEAATLERWARSAKALRATAITTVYARWPSNYAGAGAGAAPPALPEPMLALRSGAGAPAQFVFDRGALGGPAGLYAFVVSDSRGERADIEAAVLAQARDQLGLRLEPVATLTERRATFACTPDLERPSARIAPGLWAAGDYVAGPYPATLEGAVRSGAAAACLIDFGQR
ncbi:squalene-associated FAD-dependent desaturase [Tibeticola sediminis]|uniref:Squalene-associated FAD-dependent desaturase n=1 Tax=Tibeticola sediminis TaxID=1917811 RepID=A0A3N4UV64_9BURK|nr:hydroxysqualene dehydroxylase HpnE [Tibeticola sediminis]RPE72645.1 squalene-associated FAD-dependent desaturase [Tibeticola sediminis]